MKRAQRYQKRRQAERAGRRAELIAAIWLLLRGYRIHKIRYRNHAGEIDLIVSRGKWLVFIEVKTRAKGATAYDVSSFQADRIVRTANLYLTQNAFADKMDTRFDLILFGDWRWPRHIYNAFFDDGWGGRSIT